MCLMSIVSVRLPSRFREPIQHQADLEGVSFHAMLLRLLERGLHAPAALVDLGMLNPAERAGVEMAVREIEEASRQVAIRKAQGQLP